MDELKRRRLLVGCVAIAALCVQYTTLLVATEAATTERAHWNDQELTAFIDYLYEHRVEAGNGGNFKQSTFDAAALQLAPLLTSGAEKTGNMCRTKWRGIKSIYMAIDTYRNQSRFHWDNIRGANIEGKDAESVWAFYLQAKGNAPMRPFKNVGWPHFEKVQAIIPAGATARRRRPAAARLQPPESKAVI